MTCAEHGAGAPAAGLRRDILALLEEKKPWVIASLAAALGVGEMAVAEALPPEMCRIICGSHFEQVWEALGQWEKATFIVQHGGHTIEFRCRIPAGRMGRGWYNIMGDAPLGGHIMPSAISHIAFLSMPFMGLESHSVQFFGADGHVAFAVYAGRENHAVIPAVKEAFMALRASFNPCGTAKDQL